MKNYNPKFNPTEIVAILTLMAFLFSPLFFVLHTKDSTVSDESIVIKHGLRGQDEPMLVQEEATHIDTCIVKSLSSQDLSHYGALNLYYESDKKYIFSCEKHPYTFTADSTMVSLQEGENISFSYNKKVQHFYDKASVMENPATLKEVRQQEQDEYKPKEVTNIKKL